MSGIEITLKGSRQAGRSYTITTYEIVTNRPIDRELFDNLVNCGFISNGQGRKAHQVINGEFAALPAKISWESRIKPSTIVDGVNRYIYSVEIECDSGD